MLSKSPHALPSPNGADAGLYMIVVYFSSVSNLRRLIRYRIPSKYIIAVFFTSFLRISSAVGVPSSPDLAPSSWRCAASPCGGRLFSDRRR